MYASDIAHEILTAEFDPEVMEAVTEAEESGRAGWYFDPEVEGVIGLLEASGRALVVIETQMRDAMISAELYA